MSKVTRVPLLDLTRFDDDYAAEIEQAFSSVFRSGRYILGPEVDAFEAECCEYIGVRHALGVSSGSDALILALMGLGVGPGDEVICPTFTFFATAGAISRLGARPVFVDIDEESFNCDPDDIAAKISDRTKVILPVHLYGQLADMDAIGKIADAHGIAVVEDAAQAIGTEHKGQAAGSIGTIGCFSFFPSKNLGAFGDGGLVTTNDDDLVRHLRILRVHGGEPKYYHQFIGGNFRIDALQAALLRVKLRRLDGATERRQENAALYTESFVAAGLARSPADTEPDDASTGDEPLILPKCLTDRHIYNQYNVRVKSGMRDRLREDLIRSEIGTEIYYPIPLHMQKCFEDLGYKPGDFPHSERAADEIMALPIFPELRKDEITHVVERIAAFYKR